MRMMVIGGLLAMGFAVQAQPARITVTSNGIAFSTGHLQRKFVTGPDLACYDYSNLLTGQQLLRAIEPEASVVLNGKQYVIGGLQGQQQKAYFLPEWLQQLKPNDQAFHYQGFDTSALQPLLPWKPANWHPAAIKTSTGKQIRFRFKSTDLPGVVIDVHYALYDQEPLLSKWITITNTTGDTLHAGYIKNEILSLVEEESAVVGTVDKMAKQAGIYFESNYAFNNAMRYNLSDQTLHWLTDSSYTSQVNYALTTPCRVEIYPDMVKDVRIAPGSTLESVRSFELLMNNYDREQRGLAIQRMYKTVAPWVTENPIFMHLVSKNDEEVLNAIDQCKATGYEAVILSFGSHLNMEDNSEANLARWKKISSIAHAKGIKIGGYSLFSSRRISEEDDVISPITGKTGHAFFGNAPCFGSKWGLAYRDKIKQFFVATGFDIWENDGPYPGDVCASVTHPGHHDANDSQWEQMKIQQELYQWLNQRGVYINAPDWYFLNGTHKIALGYREVNFSLPREEQRILNRQNIHDGTFDKTPSMGWGFVPLTRYQGGGPEAILEPLSQHLSDYENLMVQYYGAGVQACYRGPRLYDTVSTRNMVIKVINWYKKYREILNAPMVHLRRADGRDWDGWLHVSPSGRERGLLLLFNPLPQPIKRKISLPLDGTNLKKVRFAKSGEAPVMLTPDCHGRVEVEVEIPANGYAWWVVS
ncbi:MAG TPA: alpha-galactosidase [Flavihumibacter sp.]|nr:alpha-galactosidase [Flavihumibacter sp.]